MGNLKKNCTVAKVLIWTCTSGSLALETDSLVELPIVSHFENLFVPLPVSPDQGFLNKQYRN